MVVEYTAPRVMVVRAHGEIDTCTLGCVGEFLRRRLCNGLHTMVLDLSEVTFLSCGGAYLIAWAKKYAHRREVAFRVSGDGSCSVRCALSVCGLTEFLSEAATVDETALLPGYRPNRQEATTSWSGSQDPDRPASTP